ncbi:MAG: PDZ domain-containing protein [Actinobacteria bacterium]|jgi:S1-C subfamily serine protease|nr:PDZ domain-containing protein [Actinomycetota bacterium]
MDQNDDWEDSEEPLSDRIPPIEDRIWSHPSEYSGRKPGWGKKWALSLAAIGLVLLGLGTAKTLWPTPQIKVLAKPASTVALGVDTASHISKMAQSLVSIQISSKPKVVVYGLAISPFGYILAPAHVLPKLKSYKVTVNGKPAMSASLVAENSATDTAVLKVNSTLTNFISGASQETTKSGEMTIGIGVGVTPSKPKLVISQIKETGLFQVLPNGQTTSGSFLADASQKLNPEGLLFVDSHGVPLGLGLSDLYGQWIISPLTTMLASAQKIELANGAPQGWLGIVGVSSQNGANSTSTSLPPGVKVLSVAKNSPAQVAGIKPNDDIVAVNNLKISSLSQLQKILTQLPGGSQVSLTIIRNGITQQIRVQLGVKSNG